MQSKTVKLADGDQLSRIAHTAARLSDEDVREIDDSMVIRAGLNLLEKYLSSVEEQIEEPKLRRAFMICFMSRKGLFENYNWKQSKEEATKLQKAAIVEEMQRLFFQDVDRAEEAQRGEQVLS
jgi:hypothetical protein